MSSGGLFGRSGTKVVYQNNAQGGGVMSSLVSAGSGSSHAFTPSDLSGLVWWLRADNLTQVANRVSGWADKSGLGDSGRNAAQASGVLQPLYTAADTDFNSQPSVKDDDGTRYMATSAWSATYSQPTTMLLVGASPSNRVTDGSTISGGRQGVLGGANWGIYSGGSIITSAAAGSVKAAVAGIFNGASSKIYVNDSSTSVTGNAGAGSIGSNGQGILATADGVGPGAGDVLCEVSVYNRALSQAEIAKWFAYAAARYGVPAT